MKKFLLSALVLSGVLWSSAAFAICPATEVQGEPVVVNVEHLVKICHLSYDIGYNPATKTPVYSAEHLIGTNVTGAETREGNFRPDPALPADQTATQADYTNSGYARGHMTPAGDARYSQDAMKDTFFFSNVVPQNFPMNSGIWSKIERMTREWSIHYNQVFVVTGPINTGSSLTIGDHKVVVPTSLYKVVYNPVLKKTIGFVVPNVNVADKTPSKYVVPVSNIEKMTGITFFPSIQSAIIDKNNTQIWE